MKYFDFDRLNHTAENGEMLFTVLMVYTAILIFSVVVKLLMERLS